MEKYQNNKTKHIYTLLFKDVIDASNRMIIESPFYVVYQNEVGMPFIREQKEFFEKFTKIN